MQADTLVPINNKPLEETPRTGRSFRKRRLSELKKKKKGKWKRNGGLRLLQSPAFLKFIVKKANVFSPYFIAVIHANALTLKTFEEKEEDKKH